MFVHKKCFKIIDAHQYLELDSASSSLVQLTF